MNSELGRAILDFWWLVPLVGAGLVAYRFLGWRGLLAVLTLGAAGGLYTKGKRDERSALEAGAAVRRKQALEEKERISDELSNQDPASKRDRLKRWGLPDNPPSDRH